MKTLPCPVNGTRPVAEFQHGGPVLAMPSPDAGIQAWAEHVFLRRNPAGVAREWWCHLPTATWFIAERDTVTDTVLASYLPPGPGEGGQ